MDEILSQGEIDALMAGLDSEIDHPKILTSIDKIMDATASETNRKIINAQIGDMSVSQLLILNTELSTTVKNLNRKIESFTQWLKHLPPDLLDAVIENSHHLAEQRNISSMLHQEKGDDDWLR